MHQPSARPISNMSALASSEPASAEKLGFGMLASASHAVDRRAAFLITAVGVPPVSKYPQHPELTTTGGVYVLEKSRQRTNSYSNISLPASIPALGQLKVA
ncbi:hypothetical protein AC579_7807 [Pseudocercospora musae]|uniref:Uncharacterized protein n=1 Tax=Pseudocercospora musae TaxID=113226 RepID=A0A139IJE4_9PEZI|nr:hypothetical protein AC579_7807 [Pseudocercospora musae]